jgi:hypothetical protein
MGRVSGVPPEISFGTFNLDDYFPHLCLDYSLVMSMIDNRAKQDTKWGAHNDLSIMDNRAEQAVQWTAQNDDTITLGNKSLACITQLILYTIKQRCSLQYHITVLNSFDKLHTKYAATIVFLAQFRVIDMHKSPRLNYSHWSRESRFEHRQFRYSLLHKG